MLTMHPFLPHLLSDIAAAHRTEVADEEATAQTIEEHFEAIDKWVSGEEPEHTFGYYCGLKAEDFPPAEQLTDEEMKIVCKAFERMMYTWNLGIDLPENLPAAFAYKITVDTLSMQTGIVHSGMMNFDFCSGYAPDCVFGGCCPCLKTWNEDADDDMNIDLLEDELPF